jgi:signal transduction histidine kinase
LTTPDTGPDTGPDTATGTRRRAGSGAADGDVPLLPQLEFDQLLVQLVDRAQDVMAAQGRLRGLLRANQLIIGRLDLPELLRGIVEAARELIGARYAALGVIAPDGGLAEFVHVGMPDDALARIGHLPQGKGLLGALIEDPRPIRLRHIGDDERSSGFPPGHPPMESFLGVPIRIRSEVFGNLYLAESEKGTFSAEDQELAQALAATAAAAIENARLYAAAEARGEWLQASAAVTRRLLSSDIDAAEALQFIADRSQVISDAEIVTVARPTEAGDMLRVDVAAGPRAGALRGLEVPVEASLAGHVHTTGEPVRLAQPGDSAVPVSTVAELEIGPLMVLPLRGSAGMLGVITVARERGRAAFTAEELDMAGAFAGQGAVAIELATARAERQRAEMLEDRERIAADLHDHVIQRLFAAGLTLQGTVTALPPGRARDRVLATVDDLDTTIRQIRTSIFVLQQSPAEARTGLRARLLEVATQAAGSLGFDPAVRFTGVIDMLPAAVGDDVEAVLREALSNVARHAHARGVSVDVTSDHGRFALVVTDDGVGMGDTTRRSGLANLHHRAERHGGGCAVTAAEPTGTRLTWEVPLT